MLFAEWGILILTIAVQIIYSQAIQSLLIVSLNSETFYRPCLTKECVIVAGNVLQRMNFSVDPCTDFYEYACGGWIASSVKPDGKSAWGTLSKLASDNQVIMRKTLESEVTSESKAEEKARTFYRSCMDQNDTIELRGAQPILDVIKELGGWTLYGNWNSNAYDLETDIIKGKLDYGSFSLFSMDVAEDDKNSSTYILQFDQDGLLLPTRDYYLNESEKAVADAYIKYITKVGVLLGATENKSREVAEDIFEFEKDLAKITVPDDQRLDDDKLYNKMTLQQLTEHAPFIDWTLFVNKAFEKVDEVIDPTEVVIVYAPYYLQRLSQFLSNKSLTIKGNTSIHNYLTWQTIENFMEYLSNDFQDAYNILDKAQTGVTGGEDGWRVCVAATEDSIGPALGAMYVRKAFSEEDKFMAMNMLKGIRRSFRKGINSVSWMDEKTKAAALVKADYISQMIGYPKYILNKTSLDAKFEELEFSENKYFENCLNVTLFQLKENFRMLRTPVKKTLWDISPTEVNAYYTNSGNGIVVPAGILQPPLFYKHNPPALNYGAVGVVMGHELSHAFDTQGRKYDKYGNLGAWWDPATINRFKQKIQCMVKQYSNYTQNNENLNGKLTLSENIADNGGLKASFRAYKDWSRSHSLEPILPGLNLTPTQLFFVGFGQVWCSTMTKEEEHLQILSNSHVLPKFRVHGSLANFHEFSRAFNCPLNSAMNPKDKCPVW